MEKFKDIELPEAVRRDLESGDYLFGRGIFDMKSGDAIIIALLEQVTQNIGEFEGNLIYGACVTRKATPAACSTWFPASTSCARRRTWSTCLLDTDYMTSELRG